MPRLASALAFAFTCAPLLAQSYVLPKGLHKQEGSSYHWAGWSANAHYVPARICYSYDRSEFSWSGDLVIHRLSLRRDTGVRTRFAAHSKQMKVRMSTDGFEPRRPRFLFTENLGRDSSYVFGDSTRWQRVEFPASSSSTSPAPFDVRIHLDRPFLVPATARNLQVEFLVLGNDTTEGSWYVDAEYQQGALDSGWITRLGGSCPEELGSPIASLLWPGADLYFHCETKQPDAMVLGLCGPRAQPPSPLLEDCVLHVNELTTRVGMTPAGPEGHIRLDFGRLPDSNALVGVKLSFQAIVVKQGLPILSNFGVTDALEVRIGQGYPAKVTLGTVYSYGPDLTPNDPDARFSAAYLSSRAVVLGIN